MNNPPHMVELNLQLKYHQLHSLPQTGFFIRCAPLPSHHSSQQQTRQNTWSVSCSSPLSRRRQNHLGSRVHACSCHPRCAMWCLSECTSSVISRCPMPPVITGPTCMETAQGDHLPILRHLFGPRPQMWVHQVGQRGCEEKHKEET